MLAPLLSSCRDLTHRTSCRLSTILWIGRSLVELLDLEDIVRQRVVCLLMHRQGSITARCEGQTEHAPAGGVVPVFDVPHAMFVLDRDITRMCFRRCFGGETFGDSVAIEKPWHLQRLLSHEVGPELTSVGPDGNLRA